jgi:hypothetical protein
MSQKSCYPGTKLCGTITEKREREVIVLQDQIQLYIYEFRLICVPLVWCRSSELTLYFVSVVLVSIYVDERYVMCYWRFVYPRRLILIVATQRTIIFNRPEGWRAKEQDIIRDHRPECRLMSPQMLTFNLSSHSLSCFNFFSMFKLFILFLSAFSASCFVY